LSSDCEEYVLCCKFSPLGDVFAVGLGNGTIKVNVHHISSVCLLVFFL